MRLISVFLACFAVGLCYPHPQPGTVKQDDEEEPGIITETHRGGYDNKLTIDYTTYDGPPLSHNTGVDRSSPYTPDHQLIPTVPVDPRGSKYAVVPSKPTTGTSQQSDEDEDYQQPTMPTDFEQEITGLRIPYLDIPSYIPPDESIESGEENEDSEEEEQDEEVPNHDQYFTNDFLEPLEFKDVRTSSTEPDEDKKSIVHTREVTLRVNNRPKRRKPVILTKYRSLEDDPFERYEVHEFVHEKEKPPTKKIPAFIPRKPMPPKGQNCGFPRPKMYRQRPHFHNYHYPRNYRRFPSHHYPPPPPRYRRPAPHFNSPHHCSRPKQIVKEVHFHHYDPRSSPIFNVDDHENFEHETVITKIGKDAVQLQKEINQHHNEYRNDDDTVDHEIEDFERQTESRLRNPEFYGDAHVPRNKDSYQPYQSDSNHHQEKIIPRYRNQHGDIENFNNAENNLSIQKLSSDGSIVKDPPGKSENYFKQQVYKYYYKRP